jgi:outer membrane lipoprotein SlyB
MRIYRLIGLLSLGLLAACVSHRGTMYARSDAGRPWTVQEAKVVQVTEATIEGRESAIGTVGGGFIGHAVGHSIGHGAGSSIGGAVGAVAGAIVGQKTERVATQKRAWEILVELEGGTETLAIVQPADQTFSAGEKVRLYTRSDGAARVAKL